MPASRRRIGSTVLILALATAGCSVPRVVGLGSYYSVTDPATSRVYYTDKLSREKRGGVEFRDSTTGAWISLPAAEVREISQAEFRAAPKP